MKWDDGFTFERNCYELSDPWAPHPVVSRHICSGGSSTTAPPQPDYTEFNKTAAGYGNTLAGWGGDLLNWAKQQGINLSDIAKMVSDRAGGMADWAAKNAKDLFSNWQSTYGPIMQQDAANTQQFIKDLPSTREQWAGEYGADAAQAIDQSKAQNLRKLQGEGLTRPGVAQGAIDLAQSNQRALATVAGAEAGRRAADLRADQKIQQTMGLGDKLMAAASGMAGTGATYGGQQIAAPESAVSTTAGAYAPGLQAYQTAAPYLGMWKSGMDTTFNNSLAAFKASNEASSGGFASTFLPLIGGIAGAAAMPTMQGTIWNMAGMGGTGGSGGVSAAPWSRISSFGNTYGAPPGLGGTENAATGGAIVPSFNPGGVPMAGRMVPASMSPTGGARTDDVPAVIDGNPQQQAAINTGEFIIPRRVAEWYGEKFLQNFIAKADKERSEQTVAQPTLGPPAGVNAQPPMGAMT